MTDKKTTLKRIIMFLSFAFIPPWIMQFIYIAILGCNTDTPYYTLMLSLSMLFPMVGNFMTRILTREGNKNNLLKVNLKGNVRYYITAVFLPVFYAILSTFVFIVFFTPKGMLSEILRNIKIGNIITTVIYAVTVSSLACFLAFGEECGWRGYLTPKLESLMNKPAALILSGIIWGLWHAPAIVIGHNFGTEYEFYPYSGILLMCLFCICLGTYFSALTEKTKSVFSAALAHAGNNNMVDIIVSMFIVEASNVNSEMISSHNLSLCMMAVPSVTSLITAFVIFGFSKSKKNSDRN